MKPKGTVTSKGRLRSKFLPAIYFDSSVVIDYWTTEGLDGDFEDDIARLAAINEPRSHQVIRDLLRFEKHFEKVIEIREKLLDGPSTTVVTSPLCLLELMKWKAQASLKETIVEAAGLNSAIRKGDKEIGDYLKRLWVLHRGELESQNGKKPDWPSGLEIIMGDTWLNRGFSESHGLWGLVQADIVGFHFGIDETWNEPSAYAYLQLGAADIMHILLASHLGCAFIASFDGDFKRAADIIQERTGMKVLSTPDDILDVL